MVRALDFYCALAQLGREDCSFLFLFCSNHFAVARKKRKLKLALIISERSCFADLFALFFFNFGFENLCKYFAQNERLERLVAL